MCKPTSSTLRRNTGPSLPASLPIPIAWGAAIGIGLFTLAASFALNATFGWIIVIYAVLNLAYSFKLKHVVIVDVLIVAAGFVLRVAAGVPLVQVVRFSPWLYVCMALLALFLGFAKRRQELLLLKDNAINSRAILEEYNLEFVDGMQNVVMACTIIAYSLYTFLAEGLRSSQHDADDSVCVVRHFPLSLSGARARRDRPARRSGAEDRPLQIDLVLWALSVVLILYVLPKSV